MYYVHVLSALLSHNNAEYAYFFHIRHLLPPYSLYYYALLVLSKFMPMLLADRLIICVYFVCFITGFRYLARAIGPSADLMTLLATLLLLNWPLGMGFVNFCLSLSFSFWAAGLWLRFEGTRSLPRRLAFLVLVTGIMLTHPVPLLLLLAVTGLILLVRVVHASRAAHRFRLQAHGVADLVTLGIACLNVGYVKLFAVADPLKQVRLPDDVYIPYWVGTLHRASIYTREHALAFLLGRGAGIMLYRTGLMLILVIPIVIAIRQYRRNRAAGVWTAGDSFLLLGGIIFFVLPFIPSQLNGLYYFADRLMICVWLAFLFAASGWFPRSGEDVYAPETGEAGQHLTATAGRLPISRQTAAVVCMLFVLVCNAAVLIVANRLLRPAARAIAALDAQPVTLSGQVGFVMEDARPALGEVHEVVSWTPYSWALIHILRHNNAVMANAPWMNETIIPVAPSKPLPEVFIPALRQPFPNKLQRDLLAAPQDLQSTLRTNSFFVVNQFDRPALTTPEPLLHTGAAAAQQWSCVSQGWYRLCSRPVQQP